MYIYIYTYMYVYIYIYIYHCRYAVIGGPWCLRRLSLFSNCLNSAFDKQITPG